MRLPGRPARECPLKGPSRVKGNFHARFLGGCGRVNRLHLPGADCMHHEPLYVFHGCRHEIDGQEVLLINTPFSHRSEEERRRIEDILARLRRKQPVIVVCMPFDPATFDFVKTMRVISPLDWQQKIESMALPSSLLHDLPIYDEDLSRASA